jgi:hypothetical protein
MENGTYGGGNTDFTNLVMDRFSAHLFDQKTYESVGCGANALALLTGENPKVFLKNNKRKSHYSDSFMIRNLRKYGYKVFKINKCNLTFRNKGNALYYSLNNNHLLLVSHLLKRNEATWIVHWNDIQYHNFELNKSTFWQIVNFPISTAYVLYKDEWSTKDLKEAAEVAQKYRKLTQKLA